MSFRLKTVLGVAAIESILLLVMIVGGVGHLRSSNIEALHQRADSTVRILAATAKDAVISGDLASLDTIADQLTLHPGVVYVRLLDADGVPLTERGMPPTQFPADRHDDFDWMMERGTFHGFAEVREAGALFGRVEIGLSTAEIESTIGEARRWFARVGAVEVALSALFSLMLGLYLTRQLGGLERAAERVAGGAMGFQIDHPGGDEIGRVVDAFNRMSRRLKGLYDQLHHSHEALFTERERLRSVMDNVAEGIVTVDHGGRIDGCNPAAERIFGRSAEEMVGERVTQMIVLADDRGLPRGGLTGLEGDVHEVEGIRGGGERFPLEVSVGELRAEGESSRYAVVLRDITQRKRDEAAMRLARQVFEHSSEAIVVTDAEARIIDVNPAYEWVTGFRREEVLGLDPRVAGSGRHDPAFYQEMWRSLLEEGRWSGEIWDRRKNGEVFPKWLSINAVRDDHGVTTRYIGLFTDISNQKHAEERLERLAYYDPLTGLPNRSLFKDRLAHEIEAAKRGDGSTALFFIDLDRFKQVNDTLGHDVGDELLQQVAARLRERLRGSDTVARLGGDEFTAILPGIVHELDVGAIAQGIIERLSEPFHIRGNEIGIGASIGIALSPRDGDDVEELTKSADVAMYTAKEAGRGSYRFFSEEMDADNARRLIMEANLRHAIAFDQLRLHFQPRVEFVDGRIVGVEALVRWQHPEFGLIGPDRFLSIAEESGLVLGIGEWVLDAACRAVGRWRDEGADAPSVSINLSPRQFEDTALVDKVVGAVERHALPAGSLEVEVTEGCLMKDTARSARLIERLAASGVAVVVDDYGSGCSSLVELQRLPIHALKIDCAFVAGIGDGESAQPIVESILAIARNLAVPVVAEGVEQRWQAEYLRARGCAQAQGFLFHPPLPEEALMKRLPGSGRRARPSVAGVG